MVWVPQSFHFCVWKSKSDSFRESPATATRKRPSGDQRGLKLALGPGQDGNLVRLQVQNFDIFVFRKGQTSKGDALAKEESGGQAERGVHV